jgi:hypothetical protein
MPLFVLNPDDIEAVDPQSFSALGVTERGHLQRVLRANLRRRRTANSRVGFREPVVTTAIPGTARSMPRSRRS